MLRPWQVILCSAALAGCIGIPNSTKNALNTSQPPMRHDRAAAVPYRPSLAANSR